MGKSSQVLQHGNPKNCIYQEKTLNWLFLRSCFVNNFYLILCTLIGAIILSINIQVGLNMHLYDDIGDASSSLRGSTSSNSVCTCCNYASLSAWDAYCDRQLTPNFELWVEIFCVPTCCIQMRISKSVVCLYPEKRYRPSFVNVSPTSVFDTSMKGLHEYYNIET